MKLTAPSRSRLGLAALSGQSTQSIVAEVTEAREVPARMPEGQPSPPVTIAVRP